MKSLSSALATVWILCLVDDARAFVPGSVPAIRPFTSSPVFAEQADASYLLDEFRLYNGELVDPYKILKVSKKAQRPEIRKNYIDLSRRYHPDAAMHRDILPGSCNNADDVRLQWERIKLSYEILSDRKLRTRYDRNVVIADPQAAMKRAAVEAASGAAAGVASYVGKSIFAVGKGLFSMGAQAILAKGNNDQKDPETEVQA